MRDGIVDFLEWPFSGRLRQTFIQSDPPSKVANQFTTTVLSILMPQDGSHEMKISIKYECFIFSAHLWGVEEMYGLGMGVGEDLWAYMLRE